MPIIETIRPEQSFERTTESGMIRSGKRSTACALRMTVSSPRLGLRLRVQVPKSGCFYSTGGSLSWVERAQLSGACVRDP